jgi:hypothetical protein
VLLIAQGSIIHFQKKYVMKNISVLYLLLALLFGTGCKEKEPIITEEVRWGEFLQGRTLPASDTSGLGEYMEGYINGKRFCLMQDKDSFSVQDIASDIFYNNQLPDTTSTFKATSIGGQWDFIQPESSKTLFFAMSFICPAFPLKYDGKDSLRLEQYRRDRLKTNINWVVGGKPAQLDEYQFFFRNYKAVPILPGTNTYNGQYLYTEGYPQAGSFIRLISIRQLGLLADRRYSLRRELIYEFEANLGDKREIYCRINKGRIRVYI